MHNERETEYVALRQQIGLPIDMHGDVVRCLNFEERKEGLNVF
jgi:hypothetical protein